MRRIPRSIIAIVLSFSFVLMPFQASAIAVPVGEIFSLPHGAKEGPYGAGTGLDMVGKIAASVIQRVLLNTMVNWINSGFDGNPSFVINPRDIFSKVETESAQVTQAQLANSNVCAPFRTNFNTALAGALTTKDEDTTNNQNPLLRATECRANQLVVSGNLESYYAEGGFANQGGLAPLEQSIFNPADDPITAPQVGVALQVKKQKEAKEQQQKEIDNGEGFQSYKECVQRVGGACARYEVKTPGTTISDAVKRITGQSITEIGEVDELGELIVVAIQAMTQKIISSAGLR